MKRILWIVGLVFAAEGLYAVDRVEEGDREPGMGRREESFPEHLERGGRERGPGPELPEEAVQWLAELKERDPGAYRSFMRLREKNPDRFYEELHEAMRFSREKRVEPEGHSGGKDRGRKPLPGSGSEDPERGGPEKRPVGPRGKLEPGSGPMPGQVPALEEWLRGLKDRNPEEYERLMRLREEEPELFRREIRTKLEAIREDRRRQNMEEWKGTGRQGAEEREEFERALQKGVEAWKSAESDEARGRIEREIREQIHAGLQRRMRMQEERLGELERQIDELRRNMTRQREAADRIVEERIKMMLHSERNPGPEGPRRERPRTEAPGGRGETPK